MENTFYTLLCSGTNFNRNVSRHVYYDIPSVLLPLTITVFTSTCYPYIFKCCQNITSYYTKGLSVYIYDMWYPNNTMIHYRHAWKFTNRELFMITQLTGLVSWTITYSINKRQSIGFESNSKLTNLLNSILHFACSELKILKTWVPFQRERSNHYEKGSRESSYFFKKIMHGTFRTLCDNTCIFHEQQSPDILKRTTNDYFHKYHYHNEEQQP